MKEDDTERYHIKLENNFRTKLTTFTNIYQQTFTNKNIFHEDNNKDLVTYNDNEDITNISQ